LWGHLHYMIIYYCQSDIAFFFQQILTYQRDRDATQLLLIFLNVRIEQKNVPDIRAKCALPNIIFKSDCCMQFHAARIYV